jgi:hypothetical protein
MRTTHIIYMILTVLFFISCKGEPKPQIETVEDRYEMFKTEFMLKGESIFQYYKVPLANKLLAAIEQGGLENAISICGDAAQHMIDSLHAVYGLDTRRTALSFRNPDNAPDDIDVEILNELERMLKAGETVGTASRLMEDGTVRVFQPIIAEKMCLNCHGVIGRDIKPEVYAKIREKYPDDAGTGYNEGDLRGMWIFTHPDSKVMLQPQE